MRTSENVLTLREIADRYPPPVNNRIMGDIRRQMFQVNLVRRLAPQGRELADVGGGISLFSIACAVVGMNPILIDDFADPENEIYGDEVLDLHRSAGVKVENRDVIRDGLGLGPASMDVVTTFDSMEHWHSSPKRLFHEVMTVLRPGGLFVLGVPNCVNLRKRITVPLGVGKWSAMADWYERPVFRGHVREPDVADLRYIARDMGLLHPRVLGRNWQGYESHFRAVRLLVPLADPLLRRRPSLCSDLYLVGRKPLA